ncbi:uncharacterized protein [Porites lutea]|uniref:uncharacterized protein n=1 Tax=Porites lutea TaxID=51062 RepID=UPI003CC67339
MIIEKVENMEAKEEAILRCQAILLRRHHLLFIQRERENWENIVLQNVQVETAGIRQEFENNDEQERENWENDVLQNVRVETAQIRQEIENNDEQERIRLKEGVTMAL